MATTMSKSDSKLTITELDIRNEGKGGEVRGAMRDATSICSVFCLAYVLPRFAGTLHAIGNEGCLTTSYQPRVEG